MKNSIFLLIFIGALAWGCGSNDRTREVPSGQMVPDTLTETVQSPDSLQTVINASIIWSVEPGAEEKEKLRKPEHGRLDTFSTSRLVQLINKNYPDIELDLIRTSRDTIYVNIPDSKRLTQELGDSGAENYLASATFTLTEKKNIHYVNFVFKTGDHAEPGVYSRKDFKNLQ
jgi:hypothetical protein